jgi:hypothetical protein
MSTTDQPPFDLKDPADAVFAVATDASCDPRIAEAIAYWRRIRPGSGLLPGRQHFDPGAIPRLMPYLGIADVVRTPEPRFRVRAIGTRLTDTFGAGVVGRYIDELTPGFETTRAGQDYIRVVSERVPIWYRGQQSIRVGKSFLPVERLFLPLATDGETVDMLLAVFVFSTRTTGDLTVA